MDTDFPPMNLEALLANDDRQGLIAFCEDHHPASVAEALEKMKVDQIWSVLHLLSVEKRAWIFPHFDLDLQVDLASGERRRDMAKLLEEMEADERADLVLELDEKVRDEILPLVAKAEREDIRRLASYEEGTAGSVMTTDYAVLRPDITVSAALNQLRVQAPAKETIYYVYVVNERHQLLGLVSLRKLILSKPDQFVRDIMSDDIIVVDVNVDQEEVARKIEKFDLLAIPVVSGENLLVGIVTHDDALDILRQEQQEDVEKLMAIAGSHSAREYMSTPVFNHFRNRIVWILPLALVGLVSGMIIQENETLIALIPMLAIFIPMLADTGGNTGSQSATLVVRALALAEIKPKDIFRVLYKEVRVAVMLGLSLSVVAFGRVLFFGSRGTIPEGLTLGQIGFAVSLALALQVVSATLLGAFLPMMASRCKVDPALVASPALTTCVDISGVFIFFTVTGLMLGPAVL